MRAVISLRERANSFINIFKCGSIVALWMEIKKKHCSFAAIFLCLILSNIRNFILISDKIKVIISSCMGRESITAVQ